MQGLVGGAVLDQHERLVVRVDGWAVERVARDDLDVAREVGFKGEDLGRLARCLAADNGANLGGYQRRVVLEKKVYRVWGLCRHTGTVGGNDFVNGGCLDAVDDVVAGSGH